jgi:hypothetical protein
MIFPLIAELDSSFVSSLDTTLRYYSEWGVAVGLGMFSCVMFATLLGYLIRSL